MKICLTGAHGTGKTTLINLLKEKLPNFKFIESPTRSIKTNYPNLLGDDLQEKILEKHNLNSLLKGNIIYDRCALDLIIYSIYEYNKGNISRNCLYNIYTRGQQILKRYDKIYYLEPEFKLVGDEFRPDDKSFQKDIVKLFRKYINILNSKVIPLKGSTLKKCNKMLLDIKEE